MEVFEILELVKSKLSINSRDISDDEVLKYINAAFAEISHHVDAAFFAEQQDFIDVVKLHSQKANVWKVVLPSQIIHSVEINGRVFQRVNHNQQLQYNTYKVEGGYILFKCVAQPKNVLITYRRKIPKIAVPYAKIVSVDPNEKRMVLEPTGYPMPKLESSFSVTTMSGVLLGNIFAVDVTPFSLSVVEQASTFTDLEHQELIGSVLSKADCIGVFPWDEPIPTSVSICAWVDLESKFGDGDKEVLRRIKREQFATVREAFMHNQRAYKIRRII